MREPRTISISRERHQELLEIAFTAQSLFKYKDLEGDTFNFIVKDTLDRLRTRVDVCLAEK